MRVLKYVCGDHFFLFLNGVECTSMCVLDPMSTSSSGLSGFTFYLFSAIPRCVDLYGSIIIHDMIFHVIPTR